MLKNKPAYKVPTMPEIKKTKKNGYKVISTFTGAGGTCLGYKMAGFDVIWASEFVDLAREVYQLNHDTYVDGNDIRTVSGADILKKTNMKIGEIDVLEGSPPCASFSTGGKRHKHWGEVKLYSDKKQRTDDLFDEFIRLINELKPLISDIGDATMIVPLIKEYMELGIKNDEALIKVATIFQRIFANEGSEDNGFGISEEEKEQLLKEINNLQLPPKKED